MKNEKKEKSEKNRKKPRKPEKSTIAGARGFRFAILGGERKMGKSWAGTPGFIFSKILQMFLIFFKSPKNQALTALMTFQSKERNFQKMEMIKELRLRNRFLVP